MRVLKPLVLVLTTAVALAIAVPALAADPPFPMNPYPAASQDYAFNLQTLFGHGSKVRPTVYCADSSVFRRGNQIIFRLYITDAKTGKVMTGKDMSKVVVRIAGLPDQKMAYRPQGGNPDATAPWLWSLAWLVPADYPLGTFKFDVAATVKKTKKVVVYNPVVPGTDWQITP
jgi:hypothetical protein